MKLKKITTILLAVFFIFGLTKFSYSQVPVENVDYATRIDSDDFDGEISKLQQKKRHLSEGLKVLQKLQRAKESIVLITVIKTETEMKISADENGTPTASVDTHTVSGIGTGFFIDNDKIVTAMHVLDTNPDKVTDLISLQVHFDDGEVEIPTVLAIDKENDLVILQVKHNLRKSLQTSTDIKPNQKIWMCGFNGSLKYRMVYSSVLMKIKKFDIIFHHTLQDALLVKDIPEHGMSGGPVFDGDGNVIGLIIGIYNDPSTGNYFGTATNSDALIGIKMRADSLNHGQ